MAELTDSNTLKKQYAGAGNLSTRISIHEKYSTNKQGFGNWITSHYDIKEGFRVLELGCGTGDMWKGRPELIGSMSELILSDFSEGMTAKTRENVGNLPNVRYEVIDIQDIPCGDNEFDAVIANMMLYHVPDIGKGLAEVKRVLKDGGRFYCATFGEHGIMEYIYGLFSDVVHAAKVHHNFTLQNGHDILSPYFADIRKLIYEDSLAVTNVDDLVDYIFSLSNMSDLHGLPRDMIKERLQSNMKNGVLNVPKEYGMFIAT